MRFLKNFFKKQVKAGAFFGSTPHELACFLCGIGESEILGSFIRIKNYPFEPSSAYPGKVIRSDEIGEIHADQSPPTIKVKDELIFIKAESAEPLREFAIRHGIAMPNRAANWNWITEPFLDTEFDEEQKQQTIRLLKANGIPEREAHALRLEIGQQMYKYNFDTMLWEWGILGLKDVLSAMRPKLGKEEFRQFYWKAMEIEQRHGRSSHAGS